jgi:hypothetical protein
MRRWSLVLLVILSPSLVFPASQSLAEPLDPAASTEEIKAAYEKGDYQETLRLLGRVLSLKGKPAEGYDRYQLLMLRAESQLRLKATSNALTALEEAAKVAKAAKDEKGEADARALMMLVKRSKNLQYTPKAPAGARKETGAIDLTNAKQRPDALESLYTEEKAAVKPKVQAADKSKTLQPIATALKAVVPLKDLELAATGNVSETAETTKELVDRAHKLMARDLDDRIKRTERIAERANQIIIYNVPLRSGASEQRTKRRGLEGTDYKELKETVATCKRIVDSCKELTEGFTDDTEPFEDLEDQARDTGERAHEVLTENYSNVR